MRRGGNAQLGKIPAMPCKPRRRLGELVTSVSQDIHRSSGTSVSKLPMTLPFSAAWDG
jgi:hypothetical protein